MSQLAVVIAMVLYNCEEKRNGPPSILYVKLLYITANSPRRCRPLNTGFASQKLECFPVTCEKMRGILGNDKTQTILIIGMDQNLLIPHIFGDVSIHLHLFWGEQKGPRVLTRRHMRATLIAHIVYCGFLVLHLYLFFPY